MELARAHSRPTFGILRSFFLLGFRVGLAGPSELRVGERVYGRSSSLPKGSGIAGAQRQLGALVRDRRGGPRRSRPAPGIERYRQFHADGRPECVAAIAQASSTQTAIVHFDLNRWRESHSLNGKSHFFEKLRTESDGEPAATKASRRDADIRRALETVGSGRRRRALLESHIREHVRQVLRLSASRVDSHKTFKSQGLDSLTALELCNRLETGLKLSLSPTLVWNYPNIALLAAHLGDMMKISLNDAVEVRVEPESAWKTAKGWREY